MSAIAPRSWTFDGVVRLTRIGTTYIIFTVVIGFAALNTGNNALYIGLTFMLACLLLSGIASKGGLKHLEVAMSEVREAWAGRPADAILRITNRSHIWNIRDVVITAPDLTEPLLIPLLARGGTLEIAAPFVFRRRGRVELKTLDLYTRYPFGFFLKKRRVRIGSEVIVFPRLLPESAERERFRPATGEQSSANRPGPGSDIHSFREYVRGDSMRQVYWKKSASAGRWIIKQTDLDAAHIVHVVVDPYRPRGVTDDQFEEMISAATTFIYHSLHRGLDVILTLPRVTLRAKEFEGAIGMFRALALIEPAYELVHQSIERGSVVFAVRRSDAA
ncbi:MAG TPA: DUF58 domain-containing protein [Thermoanaerobaculia bacterium]|jgi:uncharacterized protein (DUF58 family)|nr:DUF58 domain-containing protein [Thermoanaerobaculia bacterium]